MGDIQLALPARVLRRGRCICLALLMMYTTTASAQSGALAGRMLDAESSDPIGWVTVLVEDTERGQMTDEQGRFFFADLPAGRRVIQALHISYHDTRFAVEITAGDTVRVDLYIGHEELHLEGVHIEGKRVASPAPLAEPDVVFSGNKLRQNLRQLQQGTVVFQS